MLQIRCLSRWRAFRFASLCYGLPVGLAVCSRQVLPPMYMEAKEPKRKKRFFVQPFIAVIFLLFWDICVRIYTMASRTLVRWSTEIDSSSLFSLTGWGARNCQLYFIHCWFLFSTATWTSKKDRNKSESTIGSKRSGSIKKIEDWLQKREKRLISEKRFTKHLMHRAPGICVGSDKT